MDQAPTIVRVNERSENLAPVDPREESQKQAAGGDGQEPGQHREAKKSPSSPRKAQLCVPGGKGNRRFDSPGTTQLGADQDPRMRASTRIPGDSAGEKVLSTASPEDQY